MLVVGATHYAEYKGTNEEKRATETIRKLLNRWPIYIYTRCCLLCHQHFHQSFFWWGLGRSQVLTKILLSALWRCQPRRLHRHLHPNRTEKPKPNTTAREQGTGRRSAILSPVLLNKHRGESTHEQFTFNPTGAPKNNQINPPQEKMKKYWVSSAVFLVGKGLREREREKV